MSRLSLLGRLFLWKITILVRIKKGYMSDIKIRKYYIVILMLISIFLTTSCFKDKDSSSSNNPNKQFSVLDKIREKGKLVALTDYNSTNYYIYRGTPMGYQFELLQAFADYLNVELKIVTNNDLDKSFSLLANGEIDLISIGLTKTQERLSLVDFTDPIIQTRQVLVQRKPDNWRKIKTADELNAKLIRNQIELVGKTIIIQKKTSFFERLNNLAEEIGGPINIIEDPELEVEALISKVANGEIEFTISDEYIALVNQRYYPDIDVKTDISYPQNLSWVVNKGEDSLRLEVNHWLESFKKSITSRLIYNKYFKNRRTINYAKSEYNSVGGGKISPYDTYLKTIAEQYNLDWRLIASLIYQESGFQPNAKSWVGAYGLMQLMPSTAKMFGVDSLSTPEQQIEGGIKFMQWLDKQIPEDVSNQEERIKFILAAYNVGLGHVYDARRLAEKYNSNPNIWTGSVDLFLRQKSDPKFYRDSVVRYGYCRGEEPYNFVIQILDRYDHYKNLIKN